MNVTRTIRYRDSAAGTPALAGSTIGAIRDGLPADGITLLRPEGAAMTVKIEGVAAGAVVSEVTRPAEHQSPKTRRR